MKQNEVRGLRKRWWVDHRDLESLAEKVRQQVAANGGAFPDGMESKMSRAASSTAAPPSWVTGLASEGNYSSERQSLSSGHSEHQSSRSTLHGGHSSHHSSHHGSHPSSHHSSYHSGHISHHGAYGTGDAQLMAIGEG